MEVQGSVLDRSTSNLGCSVEDPSITLKSSTFPLATAFELPMHLVAAKIVD